MYSKKVLLVDDSAADRKLFTRELERAGFFVLSTSEPQEAIAAIVSGEVGCVIMDEVMPVRGHDLAALAQSMRSDISVIILTGTQLKQPPPGVLVISKDDPHGLIRAVERCMRRLQLRRTG